MSSALSVVQPVAEFHVYLPTLANSNNAVVGSNFRKTQFIVHATFRIGVMGPFKTCAMGALQFVRSLSRRLGVECWTQ
jgi:hypothetical protein